MPLLSSKTSRIYLAATAVSVFSVVMWVAPAIAGSGNDHVLNESSYEEYFKKEGNGDKNYLYTKTEFTNSIGEHCTVVTGASERAIAMVCNPKAR